MAVDRVGEGWFGRGTDPRRRTSVGLVAACAFVRGSFGRKEWRNSMHRLTRIVAALVFVAAMFIAAGEQTAPVQAGADQTYLVLYKGNSVDAAAISTAAGTMVYSYDQIGVAIARSSSATFAADVARDNSVEGAAATARFATKLEGDVNAGGDAAPQQAPV